MIDKTIESIKRKIFLLIGRALLTAIKNNEKHMKVQIVALKDETITDVERPQEYGFESYPKTGAEAFMVFPNGNRDQGIVFCIADRNYRPKTLTSGEVMVYDWNGNHIYLKSGSQIEIKAGSVGVQKMVLGETLNNLLGQLIDGILALTVTCAVPGNPSSTPINAATFTSIKSNLNTILSTGIKNN